MGDPKLEDPQRLEAFRMEIQGILSKSTDSTLIKLENVSDLEGEDMENWELLKTVLREFRSLVSKNGDINKEEFQKVSDEIKRLSEVFSSNVGGDAFVFDAHSTREDSDPVEIGGVENPSRRTFYSWLNNRLNVLSNYAELLSDDLSDKEMESSTLSVLDGEAKKIGISL